MGRGRSVCGALAAVLSAAACSGAATSTPPATGADIVVGVPLAASGGLAQEGALVKQGYDMWLDWANRNGGVLVKNVRHRVRVLYADDTSDPKVDAQLTERMVGEQKAQFLLGPYSSANTAAAAAVADRRHVPMVASNGAARQIFTQGYQYVFGILPPPVKYPEAVIDWETTLNPKPVTLALLTADDPFSLETSKGTADYAAARGQQLVYFQQYPNGSTNLYDLVQQAKATKPDLLVNIGHLLEAIAVAKAARDLRLDAKVAVYANADAPEFVQALGSAAEYVVTGSPWTSQARYKASYYLSGPEYVAAYRKKFQVAHDPDFATAGATAAGLVLQAAIERSQTLDGDRVRDALAALDLDTFYGELRFDAQHQATEKRLLVEQVQNGRMLTVAPSELAASPAIYPAPSWTTRLGLPPAPPPAAKLPGTGHPPKTSR